MDPVVQIDVGDAEAIAAGLRRVARAVSDGPRRTAPSVPSTARGVTGVLGELDGVLAQLSALTAVVADSGARHLESRVASVRAADQLTGA